jgi:hypothetical protein
MKKTKTTKQASANVCRTCGTCPTCGSKREVVVLPAVPAAPCPLPHYPAYDWTWRPWISPIYCGTATGTTTNDGVTITYC